MPWDIYCWKEENTQRNVKDISIEYGESDQRRVRSEND